jgi:hypothetical protein
MASGYALFSGAVDIGVSGLENASDKINTESEKMPSSSSQMQKFDNAPKLRGYKA